jgi:hypothetical protein
MRRDFLSSDFAGDTFSSDRYRTSASIVEFLPVIKGEARDGVLFLPQKEGIC